MAAIDHGALESQNPGFLSRERIIAQAGFNRWLVPPAALAIHLCIGMAYGFSVFWLPLSRSLGIQQPVACAAGTGWIDALFTTSCDWSVAQISFMYSLFFLFLGSSAALWGGWLERAGPRKAGLVAACCWCGGLLISALGVQVHQLWMLWIGSGVIGGIGLGLGYISPVSTLIKWFPDRRGMATGMAIMGFGGGAMIGSPLAVKLMTAFRSPTSIGVAETFLCLAAVYFVFMVCGALGYRLPPANWQPDGWAPPEAVKKSITTHNVHLNEAHKTPQFWLIWAVLFLNVSAGIGVIGMASPMLQQIFGGHLIGQPDVAFGQLDDSQRKLVEAIGAGFAGLLSLFNIFGRFFWASLSDRIGRRVTYFTFFVLGIVLYASSPWAAHGGSRGLFVVEICIIVSMYGGGFATVPAYLADMFGTKFVGAIHGRILTAWSTAGIVGLTIVNFVHDSEIAAGTPSDHAYDRPMTILAGFLLVGFIANFLIKPVAAKHFMKEDAAAVVQTTKIETQSYGIGKGGFSPAAGLAWLAVLIPILWGVWMTWDKAKTLF